MLFFILVFVFLLIAIPVLRNVLKNSGQNSRGSSSGNFSDDSAFYTASASERYGEPLDSTSLDLSDINACSNATSTDSDSGSCDSGESGGSSSD